MSVTTFIKQAALLGFVVLALGVGCTCPSTNPDVNPDCPQGTRAATSLTINANLSSIRPIGQTIQLKIRGNRTSTDLCFAPGAQTSFLVAKLEGTGTVNQAVPNLADGNWTIEVTALSGGNQAPVTLTPNLAAGGNHTLSISGNASGDLTATYQN